MPASLPSRSVSVVMFSLLIENEGQQSLSLFPSPPPPTFSPSRGVGQQMGSDGTAW